VRLLHRCGRWACLISDAGPSEAAIDASDIVECPLLQGVYPPSLSGIASVAAIPTLTYPVHSVRNLTFPLRAAGFTGGGGVGGGSPQGLKGMCVGLMRVFVVLGHLPAKLIGTVRSRLAVA
jgi:hypothetical protein